MAPPKDIARSYPKRGLTADVGFRSEPKFCGDGSTEFDGTSDFATATNYAGGNAGGTFCFWFKTEDKAASQVIFSNANVIPKDAKAQVWILSSTIKFSDTVDAIEIPSTGFEVNTWHFACMVLNSTDGIERAYFDGVEHSTIISFGSGPTTTSLAIGSRNHVGANFFNGNLAKFKIFNVALTKDQVLELYNNPGLDVPTGLTSSNLRRNYELETDFNDSGADSENATASGSPSFTVDRPQLPRGLDLARGASMARVYTGRGLDFDGSADYLETTLDTPLGSGFSVSLWFLKRSTTGSNNYLMSSGSAGGGSFISLTCTSANKLAVYDQSLFLTSGLTANLNQWHHAVLTVGTGANSYTVYLDGIGESLANTASPNIANGDFELGRYSLGSTHYHDGLIAGVRVFNQVLTADQVKELYHYPEQVFPTGVSASNLIHYWALSDYNDTGGTGGRYFQDSAGSNAMEDKASASMEFAQPVPCPQLGLQQSATRLFFSGAGAQSYVATVTPPGTTATLSGWILWGDTSRTSYLVAIAQVIDATDSLNIRINSFGDVTMYKGTEYDSGLNINEGEWNHIVVTTKSTSPYWRCWVNGVEASSPAVAPVTNITTGFVYPGSNSTPFPLNGFINDVAFWDAELDTSDVAALYNSGVQGMDVSTVQSSNLKGWWKADDFTTFKDYSGNGANAVQTGAGTTIAASFPENASGSTIVGDFSMKRKGVSVLNFGAVTNGANEYALSAKDSAFLPSFANGGAFSCFFRLQQLGEYSSIFINDDYNSGIQHRFAIYLTTIDKIIVELGDGASARANPQTTGTISDSDWHHFAMTVDYGGGATTTIKLFIDGVLDSTSTATTLAGVPNATALRFGDYVTSGANEMNGPIACLKFYQVTLSENEIKQIYNSDLRLIKGLENE